MNAKLSIPVIVGVLLLLISLPSAATENTDLKAIVDWLGTLESAGEPVEELCGEITPTQELDARLEPGTYVLVIFSNLELAIKRNCPLPVLKTDLGDDSTRLEDIGEVTEIHLVQIPVENSKLQLEEKVESFIEVGFRIEEAGRYTMQWDVDLKELGLDEDYEFKKGDIGVAVLEYEFGTINGVNLI